MPRYSGIFFSFLLVIACLGFNIVQYPVVWEMISDLEFPLATFVVQNESLGSPPPADDSSALFDNQNRIDNPSSPVNAVASPIAESSPPPSTRNPSEGYGPIPPNPSFVQADTATNTERPRSTRSQARSLPATQTVEEDNAFQERPAAKRLARQDFSEGKSEDKAVALQKPDDLGLKRDFEMSQPQSAYANRYREEEEKSPPSTFRETGDFNSVEKVAQPPNWSSLQDYGPITVGEGMAPFDKVEAFRNSPIDFDTSYQYGNSYQDDENADPWL